MADINPSTENVRAMLTETLGRLRKASEEYFGLLEKGLSSSPLPIADQAKQFCNFMQRNVTATFDLGDKLSQAKDMQEALKIQSEFFQDQMRTMTDQAKSMGESAMKVERDLDFDGPYHGKDGRIAVRRIPREHWTGHSQAVAEACKLAGYKFLPDQNGEFTDGYFPVTHSNQDEQRVSAAMGYLDRETRKRPNLTISTNTQVKELLFEGTRCVGVKAQVDGREQEFRGREIVLSCGAIHSPAHLLRAGIGPVGHLRDMH